MSRHDSSAMTTTPPLEPFEIAYRAHVAARHGPVPAGRGFACDCGEPLPCPVATALLADVAADMERIRVNGESLPPSAEGCKR